MRASDAQHGNKKIITTYEVAERVWLVYLSERLIRQHTVKKEGCIPCYESLTYHTPEWFGI